MIDNLLNINIFLKKMVDVFNALVSELVEPRVLGNAFSIAW